MEEKQKEPETDWREQVETNDDISTFIGIVALVVSLFVLFHDW